MSSLTESGNDLLQVVRRSLEELDGATARIGRAATRASQSLSVGAPPLLSANIMTQATKEFRAHQPSLRIQLFDANLTTVLEMVTAGKLDMGFGTFARTPGIRHTLFLSSPLIVIHADKDPAFRRATMTWSALRGERLIFLYPHSMIQQVINKHLATPHNIS